MWHPYSDVLVIQTPLTVINFSTWGMSYLKKQRAILPCYSCSSNLSLVLEVLSVLQLICPRVGGIPLHIPMLHPCIWGGLGLLPSFPWPWTLDLPVVLLGHAHAKLHKMMSKIFFLHMPQCFSWQPLCNCMLIVVLCWEAGVAFATKAILVQLLHFFDSLNEDFIFAAICFPACFRADSVVCLYFMIFVV